MTSDPKPDGNRDAASMYHEFPGFFNFQFRTFFLPAPGRRGCWDFYDTWAWYKDRPGRPVFGHSMPGSRSKGEAGAKRHKAF